MATQNIVHVPDDLLALLQAKAQAEGRSIEELAVEALRASLTSPSWEELLAYGQERGRASGYTEDQVPDVLHEWRESQRS